MNNIKKEHKSYFKSLNIGDRHTIEDNKTKLYLQADNKIYIIKVDNGIIKNYQEGIRKCDYLSYSDSDTNFIELKGSEIKEAYEQIEKTILHLQEDKDYSFLIQNTNVAAFIVSPLRQNCPKNIESKERYLCKKLANLCKNKPQNINSLVKYVTVKPRLRESEQVFCTQKLVCSGKVPLHIK